MLKYLITMLQYYKENFMSKYEKLWEYIKTSDKEIIELSFEEINNILGFNIDHSFLNYKEELLTRNYIVDKISLKEKYIIIKKS